MSRHYHLTVGTRGKRRAIWLGRWDNGKWHKVAKFRNANAAQEFKDAMEAWGIRGESE